MALVVRRDQRPRCDLGAGAVNHVARRLLVGLPFAAVAPVLGRDLVAFVTDLLALLEALELFLRADLEPELDQHASVAHELLLEVVDLAVGAHPVVLGAQALDALDQHAPVPGAVEDGDAPVGRQPPPEPPQVGLGQFLVSRRGDGVHLVLARVERAGDAADGAALAGGVHALERDQHRQLAEALVAREQVEPALPFFELVLVFVLGQRLRQVERAQQLAVVERVRRQRGGGRARRRGLRIQSPAQRFEHDAPGGQPAIARVGALDHDPRRVGGAGLAQRAFAHLVELVVQPEMLPVALGHAPARLRVLLQCLQALLLALLGEVEPELEDERALVGEHLLEAHVLFHRLVERGVAGLAVGARQNRLRVPRAEEDANAALGRQLAPEVRHRRVPALVLGRLGQGVGGDVARVHPFLEQVDGLALAGAVHAVDEDEHGKARRVEQLVLRPEQRLAQLRQLALVGALVDRVAKLGGFEHDVGAWCQPTAVFFDSRTPPAHQMRQAPSSETMHGPMGWRGVQARPYR